jgi:hypothetical protein
MSLILNKVNNISELLTSLFKAIYEVRTSLPKNIKIYPIIFLRDDIYELIKDNDKGKWKDSSIHLRWTERALERLTAFRLSRAIDASGPVLSLPDVFSEIFTTDTIRYGTRARSRRHIFKYLLNSTLMRPRDVISYLRECSKIAIERGSTTISIEDVRDADEEYSMTFRQEFVDEMQSVLPHVDEIFDVLSRLRKSLFHMGDLGGHYGGFRKTHPEAVDFDIACKMLFHFSVIGNQPSQSNTRIFKYQHPRAQLNIRERILIHRGLLKSLQIQ